MKSNCFFNKIFLVIWFLIFNINSNAQGKLAADYIKLLGQSYTNDKGISDLKNFKYQQGIVVGDPNEGRFLSTIDVYKKGNTALVLLSKMINPDANEYRIIDALKMISIPKNYEIRISDCSRKQGYQDEKIIAVVFGGSKRKVKLIKEAFALKDIRFEKIAIKGIQCINEGIE